MNQFLSRMKQSKSQTILYLLFIASSLLVPVGVAFAVVKIYVAWYLHSTGTLASQNSDNYGLAFEVVLVFVAAIFVTLPAIIFFWWWLARKK